MRYQAGLFVVNTQGVAGIENIDLGDLPPTNSMIVSGDAKHGGTCFGDSGGPMLVGIRTCWWRLTPLPSMPTVRGSEVRSASMGNSN